MQKTIFKNQTFYYLFIVALVLLVGWNLFTFIISKNLVTLIPITVQTIVLVLVLMKHRHAKMGINVWAIILMLGGGLVIFGIMLKVLTGDDFSDSIGKLFLNAIIVSVGLVIYKFNRKTVEVRQIDEEMSG